MIDTPVALGEHLTLEDLEAVARQRRRVVFEGKARARVEAARRAIDTLCAAGDDGPAVYGVNTGFGALAETRISSAQVRELQRNLLVSHATGVGVPLSVEETRAMMLLRAQVLSFGHSGVRVALVDKLVELLERGVHPLIPSQGSVGASGDLAPLAHLALVLIGEGEVLGPNGREDAKVALQRAGIEPLTLEAKEGLSLINGTQYICALGALALLRAERLAKIADVAGAMSLEANKGTRVPFEARLHAIRPHPGQRDVAANLWRLLDDSEIARSHSDCGRVQDAYSFRCMPQIHGASRDVLGFARGVLERELNSVTDNPSVFTKDDGSADVLSGGNFHGQPLGLALDAACMAVAELANVSERRVEQLVNPQLSSGLTPFLAKPGGLHSGFMISQVAAASLVSENKVLSHPASVDSIPSSAGREDHVSMASISAKKFRDVVSNVEKALAIELMVAAQGIEQRRPLKAARGVEVAHAAVRSLVAPLEEDRVLYRDIEAIDATLIRGEHLLTAVQDVIGPLL